MSIPKYLWADCETTGLEPRNGDLILEVAAVITDAELRQIGPSFEALIYNGSDEFGQVRSDLALSVPRNKLALEMHTKNGLLEELRTTPRHIATTRDGNIRGYDRLPDVEYHLINWMKSIINPPAVAGEPAPEPPKLWLAGSTIAFDRGFFEAYMPTFIKLLGHRNRDVSDTKMAVADALGWEYPKAEAHRAAADVQESLGVARDIQAQLRQMADVAGYRGVP